MKILLGILVSISQIVICFSKHKCDDTEYDYIIVGAGSAGSVVATRLTEDPHIKVLVLEAGGEPIFPSWVPLISFQALGSKMDWNYRSVPQKNCCNAFENRQLSLNRGKALGGTGSLNFMTYTRGNRKDYDQWESFGNKGWGFNDLYQYFLNLEDYRVPRSRDDDPYHHEGGPISVEIPSFKSDYADAFLQAGYELGYPLVDYNARYQLGFMYPPVYIKNGKRSSSYTGYLRPAMNSRSNLKVLTHATVTKIIVNDMKEAVGVKYDIKKTHCTARARYEVILCAGAYNSPQVLLLSGIGPSAELKRLKIPVVLDLPGVGQNLQEHALVGGYMYYVNQSNAYNSVKYENQKYLKLWKKTRTGPMTCPESFEGIAFYQTEYVKEDDWPDIEIFYNSDNTIKLLKKFFIPLYQVLLPPNKQHMISFIPILLRPKSRGTVTLKNKDPHHPPLIDPRLMSHPDDVTVMVEGIKFAERIAATHSFQRYGAKLMTDGPTPLCNKVYHDKDEYYKCVAKSMAHIAFHPCCTNKMGPSSDSYSVVDDRLRVHGVKNLRVVDASIMPRIVSGHTNTACLVIAEKASVMIKEDRMIGGGA